MEAQRQRDRDDLASGRLDGYAEQLLRDRLDASPIEELTDRLARTGAGDYHADLVAVMRLLRQHLIEHEEKPPDDYP